MTYNVVAPLDCKPEEFFQRKIVLHFDPSVLHFIHTLSAEILTNDAFRNFPELISMAYWMRKTNLTRLEREFEDKKGDRLWIGRGIVFHIAPSNVDSLFVYSWFLSMLAGNVNIIRISSKTNRQIELLLEAVNKLCREQKFSNIADRFMIVRYEHNDEITGFFSSVCDVRVIWGGDGAVRALRRIPLKPAAVELTFADKFSFSLIKAERFLEDSQKDKIIADFYNDAYWFGQMACSSPRLIVWVGKNSDIEMTREIFWRMLEKKVMQRKPEIVAATAMNKLVAEYSIAALNPHVTVIQSSTSLINRMLLESFRDINRDLHCGGGLFYELKIDSLDCLVDVITKKEQTVAVLGFDKDELTGFIKDNRPQGIDRFVSIGKSLQFSATWDGHDLLREFCREIEFEIS